MKVRGVNLGNWLVLEKWMNPAMFQGTEAEDEYWLPRRLSKDAYEERIRIHRSEYITERDFVTIQSWGMNAVRIPVPYFIFGDREPFIGCVEELDKAFCWAGKYGLKILIDLHTAPMGQNGFDNGGICGVCRWAQFPEEVAFELTVLERLCERYGTNSSLWGIEALNEPMLPRAWEFMEVEKRYKPMDKKMAEGSGPISYEFIRGFYLKAYERMRKYLPEDKYIVIHDGFELTIWKDFMQEGKYKNVVLDTHKYLMTPNVKGHEWTAADYEAYIEENFAGEIRQMKPYFPVICGEWCLSNAVPCAPQQKKEVYQAIARSELKAWEEGLGYFYWSYKLLIDTVNDPAWKGWDSWDLGRCIDSGWFPLEQNNGTHVLPASAAMNKKNAGCGL